MNIDSLQLFFPEELLSYFEMKLAQELGHVKFKEDFIEIIFEEKNVLPEGYSTSFYESKGFNSKRIQDFPIRGKAVFLIIRRRVWRHKETKETIKNNFSFIANSSKFTSEMAAFLKEFNRDEA